MYATILHSNNTKTHMVEIVIYGDKILKTFMKYYTISHRMHMSATLE